MKGIRMQRLIWSGMIVIAFGVGLAIGVVQRSGEDGKPPTVSEIEARVTALQRQLTGLQEQLAAKEDALAHLRQRVQITLTPSPGPVMGRASSPVDDKPAPSQPATTDDATEGDTENPPRQSEEVALAHFYQYLDETAGMGWQERRRRAQELLDTLHAVGEPAVLALIGVLEAGLDTRERRAAARLLGALQAPRALPVLQDVLENEPDLMLRRAAARGLARLQMPETVPVLETLLASGEEDRFVRMSAAYGLAQLGEAKGISGLEQIFTESTTDGRGHYLAFRALTSLNHAQSVPLMRQMVTSEAEVMYRVGAIQFLAEQGDQGAVPLLQQVMASPDEQPSVREAAERALIDISNNK